MYCKSCGAEILGSAQFCNKCGQPAQTVKPIMWGYLCALISLLLFPPAFGIAGLVIGIINLTRGHIGHGIAQIILSVTCGGFGMLLGALSMMA